MQGTVAATEEGGYIDLKTPVDPALLAALFDEMAPLRTSVGSRAEVLLELAGIKTAMRTWYRKQPDQVIREAQAYSARLTELWTDLRLLESKDRQYVQLRTFQVGSILNEIDRQYKFVASRIAMMRQDLDMVK